MPQSILTFLLLLSYFQSHSQKFKWAGQIGGSQSEYSQDITKDSDNNLIVVGRFANSGNFNPDTTAPITLTSNGGTDAFICKIDSLGNLVWAKSIGGSSTDIAFGVNVDDSNNIYIAGYFENTVDFNPSSSLTNNISAVGFQDVFITKWDSNGDFIWANSYGTPGSEIPFDLCLDNNNNAYITGTYRLMNMPHSDVFVTKFNFDGSKSWTRIFGGAYTDIGYAVKNKGSQLYLTGTFSDTVSFNSSVSSNILIAKGSNDVFVSVIDTAGLLIDIKHFSGSGNEIIYDIDFDLDENIVFTGTYTDTAYFGFDSVKNNISSSSFQDAFIWSVDSTFKTNWISTQYGLGNQICKNTSIVDSFIYVGCSHMNTTYLSTDSSLSMISRGSSDGLVAMYNLEGMILSSTQIRGVNQEQIECLVATSNHHVYYSGHFYGPTMFEFDTSARTFNSRGSFNLTDVFLASHELCPNSFDSLVIASCDSLTSPSGKYVFKMSGFYRDTLVNSKGCDSILFIDLTVDTSTFSSIIDTACESYIFPSGRVSTLSGVYFDTIPNQRGCDSIIQIELVVNKHSYDTLKVKACGNYTSPSGKLFASNANFSDTIPNWHGCDSILQISLKIGYPYKTILSPRECYRYVSPSKNIYESSGFYQDTIQSSYGCDSVFDINLIIDSSTFVQINRESCDEFVTITGKKITSSMTVNDTIVNTRGCDSIIEYNIDIISINPDVIQRNDSLVATENADVYQWYECLDPPRRRHIQWAVSHILKPVNSGLYSVELYKKKCFKASECVEFYSVGIEGNVELSSMIYPNPFDKVININTALSFESSQVRLFNSVGEIVLSTIVNEKGMIEIPEDLPSGMYYMELVNGTSVKIHYKMLKL